MSEECYVRFTGAGWWMRSGPLLVLVSRMPGQVVSKPPSGVLCLPSVKSSLKATLSVYFVMFQNIQQANVACLPNLLVLNKFEL